VRRPDLCFVARARVHLPAQLAVEDLAPGESVIEYKTRIAHSEALIVIGTGYDVDHLDQPWASLSLGADIHLNGLNNGYGRMYLWARSVEMGT
jgi:hypothetical protein